MKFGLLSMKFAEGNTEYNRNTIISCLRQYAGSGIDLLCFGEAFLQGFDALTFYYEDDINTAISTDSSFFRSIQQGTKDYNLGVTFGYYERDKDLLFSSQAVIANTGELVYNFKRVSVGWKEPFADNNYYKEGPGFDVFQYKGKRISIGLCGDLWDDENVKKIRKTGPEIVLWPVYLDYPIQKWASEKHDYALRAKEICRHVLLVNSLCDGEDRAKGGAIYLRDGIIAEELPGGKEGILTVEI